MKNHLKTFGVIAFSLCVLLSAIAMPQSAPSASPAPGYVGVTVGDEYTYQVTLLWDNGTVETSLVVMTIDSISDEKTVYVDSVPYTGCEVNISVVYDPWLPPIITEENFAEISVPVIADDTEYDDQLFIDAEGGLAIINSNAAGTYLGGNVSYDDSGMYVYAMYDLSEGLILTVDKLAIASGDVPDYVGVAVGDVFTYDITLNWDNGTVETSEGTVTIVAIGTEKSVLYKGTAYTGCIIYAVMDYDPWLPPIITEDQFSFIIMPILENEALYTNTLLEDAEGGMIFINKNAGKSYSIDGNSITYTADGLLESATYDLSEGLTLDIVLTGGGDGGDGDDGGVAVPGYPSLITAMASIGAVVVLIKRRK